MDTKELKNKFIIYNLVKNHFSLRHDSLAKFKNALFYEMDCPKEYKFIEETKDKRFYIDLEENISEKNAKENYRDYKAFTEYFNEDLKLFDDFSFKAYKDNKISLDKQQNKLIKIVTKIRIIRILLEASPLLSNEENKTKIKEINLKTTNQKISKLLADFRNKEEFEFLKIVDEEIYSLNLFLTKIIAEKGTKKSSLKIVISRNFADFISVSSGCNTKSCLNLGSDYQGAFWSGLPGTIMDKNRALVYITDGTENDVYGIKTPRMLYRSWILTLYNKDIKKNIIQTVRFYPSDNYRREVHDVLYKMFEEVVDRFSSSHIRGRYYFEPIFNEDNTTCFIYQDSTKFKFGKKNKTKNSLYLFYNRISESGNYQKLYIDGKSTEYQYSNGLEYLIDNKMDLLTAIEEGHGEQCEACGSSCDVEYSSILDGLYCDDCLNERVGTCDHCGEYERNDDLTCIDDNYYCERCVGSDFSSCDECGDYVRNEDTYTSSNNGVYCEYCYNDKFDTCGICGEDVDRNETIVTEDETTMCESCAEEHSFNCERCENTFNASILVNYSNMDLCEECYKELVPEKDLFEGVLEHV